MSLSIVISSFRTGTYTVTRLASDTHALGVRTVGSSSTFTVDASVQPVTGKALRLIPEGRSVEDFRVLWIPRGSTALILTPNPDTISIDSKTYEVFAIFPYSILDPTFHRVMVARQGVPE